MTQDIWKCLFTRSKITCGSKSSKESKGSTELVAVQPESTTCTASLETLSSIPLQLQLPSPTHTEEKGNPTSQADWEHCQRPWEQNPPTLHKGSAPCTAQKQSLSRITPAHSPGESHGHRSAWGRGSTGHTATHTPGRHRCSRVHPSALPEAGKTTSPRPAQPC